MRPRSLVLALCLFASSSAVAAPRAGDRPPAWIGERVFVVERDGRRTLYGVGRVELCLRDEALARMVGRNRGRMEIVRYIGAAEETTAHLQRSSYEVVDTGAGRAVSGSESVVAARMTAGAGVRLSSRVVAGYFDAELGALFLLVRGVPRQPVALPPMPESVAVDTVRLPVGDAIGALIADRRVCAAPGTDSRTPVVPAPNSPLGRGAPPLEVNP